jgi:hypothetical protein
MGPFFLTRKNVSVAAAARTVCVGFGYKALEEKTEAWLRGAA